MTRSKKRRFDDYNARQFHAGQTRPSASAFTAEDNHGRTLDQSMFVPAGGSPRKTKKRRSESDFNLAGPPAQPGKDMSKPQSSSKAPQRKQRHHRSARVAKRTTKERVEAREAIFDEQNIRRNYAIPSPSDYPNAHSSLFGRSIISAFHNYIVQKNLMNVTRELRSKNGLAECSIIANCPLDQSDFDVIGHGRNQNLATQAAYLHLLAKMHESGTLTSIFADLEETTIDKETLEDEKDAVVDIYNYSARYGALPVITSHQVTRLSRGKKLKLWEVIIKLENQDMKAVGLAREQRRAETMAAIRFKQEAEKHHAEHGDQTIIVKDASSLNMQNARKFVEFCRGTPHAPTIEAKLEDVRLGLWEGRGIVNGTATGSPMRLKSKRLAEDAAFLSAALSVVSTKPDLLTGFRNSLSSGGAVLLPLHPEKLVLDPTALTLMEETIHRARKSGLKDELEALESDEDNDVEDRRARARPILEESDSAAKSQELKAKLAKYHQSPILEELRSKRDALPMTQYRSQVLDQIRNNPYSVIVGATGSGKTTQVPQILLDDAISKDEGAKCNVICTQPRRIAATSVARRVAEERNERLQESVGYHVRFDAKNPVYNGSITYCTTGILLQQLQHSPDEMLEGISHIVIDEVHERDIIIDFLMIILKKTLKARRFEGKSVPTVVLMSATIDSELFAKYFEETTEDGQILSCPSLSVPGRTFPVSEKYLDTIMEELEQSEPNIKAFLRLDEQTSDFLKAEDSFIPVATSEQFLEEEDFEAKIDWKRELRVGEDISSSNEAEDALVPKNLVATTIAHISKTSTDGAILVFLPGLEEIRSVKETLLTESPLGVDFNSNEKFRIHMLHSSVPAHQQQEVFNEVPDGCRKIILSTNIAETSITIPDIQYVVDTGKLRENRYDQVRRITRLQCTWISKSNAKQRAGRAGRVQNGNYYALYSRKRGDSLRAIGLPEMLRSDLQEICLDIKAQKFKSPIREFLAEAIEPPPPSAVDASVINLVALQALTEDEKLTALGRILASLPIHPSLGKMIILGGLFSCLDPMVVLGAALNERPLLISPLEKRQESRAAHSRFLDDTASDHYAMLNAYRQARDMKHERGEEAFRRFCLENFIHMGAFRTIESTTLEIESILVESGLIPYVKDNERFHSEIGVSTYNTNVDLKQVAFVKALVLSGVHPNLAISQGRVFRTLGERNALLHPSSLNARAMRSGRGKREEDDSFGYGTLMSYTTMARSTDGKTIFLRDTTQVTPLMALLFGGRLKSINNGVVMDDWLPYRISGPTRDVRVLVEFKKALERVMNTAFREVAARRKQMSEYMVRDHRTGRSRPMTLKERRDADLKAMSGDVVDGRGAPASSGTIARPTYLGENRAAGIFAKGLLHILTAET